MPMIDWKQIVVALQAKKIPFVLTGAYGIATWTGRPRSTHDVDILVKAGRNHQRAIKAMQALYPDLEMHNDFGVAAFFVPGERESVIDVTYPHRLDIAQTLETAIMCNVDGVKVRIPKLEAALANKYGAMLALNRDKIKRAQDAVDFATMVKHSLDPGRDPIDMEWLKELGELVWPGGGGEEIVRFVEQAKAGEVPNPNA
jgi:nucleotidyltransferase AbiEii toxin of type IV toxin-antitoxin system